MNTKSIFTTIGIIVIAGIIIVAVRGGDNSAGTAKVSDTLETKPMLQITDTKVGTGAEVVNGSKVSVHYTGTLENGTKFDSSRDSGTPFEFTVGIGKVIKGWDEGLIGMKVGGMRKLVIPADLAYGDQSPSPLIPAGSTLHFDVEVVGIK